MQLVILCEGDTEKAVLRDFLKPFCGNFSRVAVVNAKGAGRLKNEFKNLTELELRSNSQAVVFCLIDLLNAPFNFPRTVSRDPNPSHAQYVYIKQYMEDRIDTALRDRFFAFPVVREIETWLLADADAVSDYLSLPRDQPFKRPHNPEEVIDPSQKLDALIRRWRRVKYVKTIHGIQLFGRAKALRVALHDSVVAGLVTRIAHFLTRPGICLSTKQLARGPILGHMRRDLVPNSQQSPKPRYSVALPRCGSTKTNVHTSRR